MNNLLAAITNLINTGGSLADDALYLYFVAYIVSYAVLPLTAFAILRGVALCIRTGLKDGARNNYIRARAFLAGVNPDTNSYWTHPRMDAEYAKLEEAFNR